jgi:hypothetical protein
MKCLVLIIEVVKSLYSMRFNNLHGKGERVFFVDTVTRGALWCDILEVPPEDMDTPCNVMPYLNAFGKILWVEPVVVSSTNKTDRLRKLIVEDISNESI